MINFYENINFNQEPFNAVMARMEKIELLAKISIQNTDYKRPLEMEIEEIKRRYLNQGYSIVDTL
jgi:hypothetical protein